jgi:hypothetical protein
MRPRDALVVPLLLSATVCAQDAMQYGAHLMTTVELGGRAGTTNKALVIRLGDDAAVAFDTGPGRGAAGG